MAAEMGVLVLVRPFVIANAGGANDGQIAGGVGTEPDGGLLAVGGGGFYGQGRWGDYTAVAPGGQVSGGGTGSLPVMYFAGTYARSDGTWGTAIGKNSFTRSPHPSSAVEQAETLARAHRAGVFLCVAAGYRTR
jgi:hypothetical protein